jgi:glycerol-3-phosphate acyltransferase PlsX
MLGALIARGAIRAFSQRMNPSRYNGASLLGLRGLVFKSHGGENAYGYGFAIKRAYEAVHYDVLSRISKSIAELMPQTDPSPQSQSTPPDPRLTEPKTA